jgi:hypothetical protein
MDVWRRVGIVTHVAFTRFYRPVHEGAREGLRIVTAHAELLGRGLESESVIGLMRIMTSHALSIGDGCVRMFQEHHVTTGLVAGETELLPPQSQLEGVIPILERAVAHCTLPDTDGTVHPLFGTHRFVALAGNAPHLLRARRGDRHEKDGSHRAKES